MRGASHRAELKDRAKPLEVGGERTASLLPQPPACCRQEVIIRLEAKPMNLLWFRAKRSPGSEVLFIIVSTSSINWEARSQVLGKRTGALRKRRG